MLPICCLLPTADHAAFIIMLDIFTPLRYDATCAMLTPPCYDAYMPVTPTLLRYYIDVVTAICC